MPWEPTRLQCLHDVLACHAAHTCLQVMLVAIMLEAGARDFRAGDDYFAWW